MRRCHLQADIAGDGTPEKPLLLPTRKAWAKGGISDECVTVAIKACLAAGSSPQACAAMRSGMKVRIRPSAQQTRHISPSFCGTDQPQGSDTDGGLNAPDDAEYEGRSGSFRTVLEVSWDKSSHESPPARGV